MSVSEEGFRYRIGVDENGLGPRLGPMIVTAILARVTAEGFQVASRAASGALAKRLGDSKQLVAHGDVALGEAWARALVAQGCGRGNTGSAESPDALIHAIASDDRSSLRSLCPSHIIEQCWSTEAETFSAGTTLVNSIHHDLDKLAQRGVQIVAVRSVILCAKRMNDGLLSGKNRFLLDLHAMERLIVDFRDMIDGEVVAVCGKVGGFAKYSTAFGPLSGRLHSVLEEGRGRSVYHFPGLGEIAFVRDSDASDLCVAMASMVGKYMREALMSRIARYYQRTIDNLPNASGYYDPVTTAFMDATRLVRNARHVPDSCFERKTASSDPERQDGPP